MTGANSTGVARKFGFDTVFDAEGEVVAPVLRPRIAAYTAEDIAAERAMAFAEGQRSAIARAEGEAAAALQTISANVAQAMGTLVETAHQHRAGAAALAMAAARKIADAALEQFPEAPAAAALAALATELEPSPRLVVRTTPDLCDRMQAALERVAQACGYAGQITVKAEPSASPAAFLFDWGDGRAAFDPSRAAERVADALDQALAAEGLHAEPLPHLNEAAHG